MSREGGKRRSRGRGEREREREREKEPGERRERERERERERGEGGRVELTSSQTTRKVNSGNISQNFHWEEAGRGGDGRLIPSLLDGIFDPSHLFPRRVRPLLKRFQLLLQLFRCRHLRLGECLHTENSVESGRLHCCCMT